MRMRSWLRLLRTWSVIYGLADDDKPRVRIYGASSEVRWIGTKYC